MQLDLDSKSFGYYFNDRWLKQKITQSTDIPDQSVVVLKTKEWIDDLNRSVIQTAYYWLKNNELQKMTKLEISDIMADLMIEFMEEEGYFPPDTKLKKITKNIATLSFKPDEFDEFNIKLRRKFLEQDPSEFVEQFGYPDYSNFDPENKFDIQIKAPFVGTKGEYTERDDLKLVHKNYTRSGAEMLIFRTLDTGSKIVWFTQASTYGFREGGTYKVKFRVRQHKSTATENETHIHKVEML